MQLHQVAARPFARSVLAARSSPLSSGAIAGAVVGSFVGVLLIALCLFPFIVRARRSRLGRHGDPSLAEMGQSPGGLIYAPQDLDDSSSKRFSKDHLVPGAEPSLEDGADHGAVTATPDHKPPNSTLPSPVSPSPSPTRVSLTSAAVQVQSPTNPSHPRYGSKGTLGRESSDSYYAHPSRELTAITSAGITEEPEPFAEHGHFPHLRESLRNLLHHRHSSHRNHDSRDSTQGAAEGPRSPSLATTDILPQPGLTPSDLEIDPETRGLAWDYYHPEPSDAYPQSAPTPISASIAPLSIAPTSGPAAGVGVPSSMTTRPAVGELDAISPDSDKTVTPASFSRQSTFGLGRKQPGPLQRTDSLPAPTIVADIPSPPLLHYDIGPSGNPMEMMRPTNPAESAWMLEHEIRKIETSPPPPPPLLDPVPSTSIPPDEAICGMPERDPIVKHESPYPSSDFPPYPSPSQGPAEPGAQIVGEPPDYYVTSDYATPGFSTGASTEHTPDTRLTPYTASPSPSPPSDADAPNNGQSLPLPGLPRGLSRTPSPSPSSSGPSPVTSPGQPAGPSPERSPARPPGGFVCPSCGSRKQSWHQLNHHQRYHKRPFPCKHPGCELSFGTITHLNRHINDRHQKTRGYHCTQPGCAWSRQGGKSFARKDNWKRHMRNTHGVSGVETEEENLDDLLAADVAMSGT